MTTDDMGSVIALVDEVMQAIDRCEIPAQVDECGRHYADAIKILAASPVHRVRVIHIRNYAALRRSDMMRQR